MFAIITVLFEFSLLTPNKNVDENREDRGTATDDSKNFQPFTL